MKINKKVKILFVVMDFWQAGAERFCFEIDASLNKNVFDTTILSIRNLQASEDFGDHYYSKHLDLKTKIFFYNNIIGKHNIFKSLKTKIFSQFNKPIPKNKKLSLFLEQFDVISWMGEYTFGHICNYLKEEIYSKSIIHLMTAKFQGTSFFGNFPKNKEFIFTSGYDDSDELEYELSEFCNYKHILFPLNLNIRYNENRWRFKLDKNKKKIGIFTRLSPLKPLDPFFYAFHLLLNKLPETELHIFGAGDPDVSGVSKYLTHTNIKKSTYFKGHQDDIVQTAINEELDLVWFQGYKNRPAGYAGFDICLSGVPQLFWDFNPNDSNLLNNQSVYPLYKNMSDFVEKSIAVLTNQNEAVLLSKNQFNDVVNNRDIKKWIPVLEKEYVDIIKNQRN